MVEFLLALTRGLRLALAARDLKERLSKVEDRLQLVRDRFLKASADYITLFERDCKQFVHLFESSKIIHWTWSQFEQFVDLYDQEYTTLQDDERRSNPDAGMPPTRD